MSGLSDEQLSIDASEKTLKAQLNLMGVSMHREKAVKLTFPPELFHTWNAHVVALA